MLIATLFSFILWQDPAPPTTASDTAPTETATASAPEQTQAANRRRRDDGLICERRAPTGSTLTRRVCRTAQQNRTDADRARDTVGQITGGAATEPLDPGPIIRP